MLNIRKFLEGLRIIPKTTLVSDSKGEFEVEDSSGKLNYHNGASRSPVVTEAHAAVLTNKSIDADNSTITNLEVDNLKAGVLNTSTTLASASDAQVPSALAVKTYVDNQIATENEASEITFVPVGNITATDVQAMGAELDSDLTAEISRATTAEALVQTNLTAHLNDTVDAHDASAISLAAIPNLIGTNVQSGMEDLTEFAYDLADSLTAHITDAVDAHDASAISNIPSGNLAATEVQAALNELQSDIDTRATQTALTAHINNATDAHDASAISNIPSGNLAATNIQAAVNELQSDIDTGAAALTSHEADTSTHGVTTIAGLSEVQTFSNKSFSDAVALPELGSTPVNPSAGFQKIYMKADGKFYKLTSTGVETEVGSGSGGGISDVDSLLIQNFDDVSVSDFTQTGLTFNTVNSIHGTQSAQLIHQGAINQSFKQTFAVDRKFRGQLTELSLAVRSTATDGNLTLLVTDETNSASIAASQSIQTSSFAISATTTNSSTTISGLSNTDINLLDVGMAVSGAGIATNTVINSINATAGTAVLSIAATASATVSLRISTLPIRRAFSFTIPDNCLSMSYTITALPEANSPRSTVDDLVLKLASTSLLSTSVVVPVITDWTSYSPLITGFGTPTSVEAQWRQNGENHEYRVKFISGTPTAVEARVGLANGATSANTSKIPSIQLVGYAHRANATTNQYGILIEPSVSYLTFDIQGGATGLSKANGDAIIAASQAFSFFASVPVSGLTATTTKTIALTQSGIIQEADSAIRLTGFTGYGSTNNKIARFTTLQKNIGSDIQYNDSATLGASFTILKAGIYDIEWSANASAQREIGLSVNSTQLTTTVASINAAHILSYAAMPAGLGSIVAYTGYFEAGDVIRPHTDGGIIASVFNFSISKAGSLKQVNVNTNSKITIPTSELRFEGASSRGSTATAIVKFDTLAKIRGDAFTVTNTAADGTYVTMLRAGKLDVGCTIRTATQDTTVQITRNQLTLTAVSTNRAEILANAFGGDQLGNNSFPQVRASVFVAAGDVIRIASSSAPTSVTNSNFLELAFQEQSVQVSVSNTLPQFSESDSSVRVDTANGYGSTGTAIRRFSNVRDNIGVDVEYADSATNGASFTAKTSGIYAISYQENFAGASYFAISKNQASLTATASSLTPTERLAMGTTDNVVSYAETISWEGYLAAGDVIRANGNGAAAGTNAFTSFTMSKVGRPNVTGVNVTPFVNVPQPTSQSSYLSQSATFVSATITGALTSSNGSSDIYSYNSSTGIYTALKKCNASVSVSFANTGAAASQPSVVVNGNTVSYSNSTSVTGALIGTSWSGIVNAGETFYVTNSGGNSTNLQKISVLAEALADQILTAPETFSSDTAALTYAGSGTYTLATLANAPVGTFITYTYAATGNVRTQTTTAPTQTSADMNTNGILLYARSYNAASTAAQPSAYSIQIGKGLKGKTLDLYKAAGRAISGTIEFSSLSTSYSRGIEVMGYSEVTGILTIDAGYVGNSSNTNHDFNWTDMTASSPGYLVINASKNPALTGLNINRVAARGVSSSGQSIPNGANTTVLFDATKTFDTHGALNAATGIFTAPEAGYYQVNAHLNFVSSAWGSGNAAIIRIFKNGLELSVFNTDTQAAATYQISPKASDICFLAKGETLEIKAFQNRGSATALSADSTRNCLSIIKVGN